MGNVTEFFGRPGYTYGYTFNTPEVYVAERARDMCIGKPGRFPIDRCFLPAGPATRWFCFDRSIPARFVPRVKRTGMYSSSARPVRRYFRNVVNEYFDGGEIDELTNSVWSKKKTYPTLLRFSATVIIIRLVESFKVISVPLNNNNDGLTGVSTSRSSFPGIAFGRTGRVFFFFYYLRVISNRRPLSGIFNFGNGQKSQRATSVQYAEANEVSTILRFAKNGRTVFDKMR